MDRLLALFNGAIPTMYALTYNLPNGKAFAFAPRSGTSSLGAAAVQQFFPDRWHNQTDGMAHRALPFTIDDEWRNCVISIRNPIARFISLCARSNTSPDKALSKLYWSLGLGYRCDVYRSCIEETSVDWLYHYFPLSPRIGSGCQLIPFERLSDAAQTLGLTALPHINAVSAKPMLTSEEEDIVRKIYAADISLWEALGQ
jgi:hypothetical protein